MFSLPWTHHLYKGIWFLYVKEKVKSNCCLYRSVQWKKKRKAEERVVFHRMTVTRFLSAQGWSREWLSLCTALVLHLEKSQLLWEMESEDRLWLHAPKLQLAALSNVFPFSLTSQKLCCWAHCQAYDECPICFFPAMAKLLEMIVEFPPDKRWYPTLFQKYTWPDHTPICFCS